MECDFGTSSWYVGMAVGVIATLVAKYVWKEIN